MQVSDTSLVLLAGMKMSSSKVVCVRTATIRGIESVPINVEVSVAGGIPGVTVVGMPDSAVLEARSRVRCAINACGFAIPRRHITINLSPADMRKTGSGFDLPMAVAILVATGQLSEEILRDNIFVGELTLNGDVSPVRGTIAYATLAHSLQSNLVISDKSELDGIHTEHIYAIQSLRDLCMHTKLQRYCQRGMRNPKISESCGKDLEFGDVIDQELAKRALVLAAIGSHGMLMVGPPGSGKTMLARRFLSILPKLAQDELQEALLIHSVAGESSKLLAQGMRPFRAPHHSISLGGLIGGGRPVLPGEVSLAHKGVLFLDELPEFATNTLQALRQPLEDKKVRLVRVDGLYTFPCDFQLLAAANPCPCGFCGDPDHLCTCTPTRIDTYQSKIGGPLMDRIDIVCDVVRPSSTKVIEGDRGLTSKEMRQLVISGREYRRWREEQQSKGDQRAVFEEGAQRLFERYARGLSLGGRSIARVSRVARTVADLEHHELVTKDDLSEAVAFRSRILR